MDDFKIKIDMDLYPHWFNIMEYAYKQIRIRSIDDFNYADCMYEIIDIIGELGIVEYVWIFNKGYNEAMMHVDSRDGAYPNIIAFKYEADAVMIALRIKELRSCENTYIKNKYV